MWKYIRISLSLKIQLSLPCFLLVRETFDSLRCFPCGDSRPPRQLFIHEWERCPGPQPSTAFRSLPQPSTAFHSLPQPSPAVSFRGGRLPLEVKLKEKIGRGEEMKTKADPNTWISYVKFQDTQVIVTPKKEQQIIHSCSRTTLLQSDP